MGSFDAEVILNREISGEKELTWLERGRDRETDEEADICYFVDCACIK